MDWTAGYVADIGYTFGYYQELNPLRLRLAFANAGLKFPEVGTACELGFGQGVSVNMHAAASVTKWSGTDFNPSQAAFAAELAAISGAGAQIFDEAFDAFCNRTDIPDFDYIGLHGIWSWISDENRHVIVEFIRRKLKVGGVLYISYNTQPGWASFAPLRHLMSTHADIMGSEAEGTISRVSNAVEFAGRLLGTNPNYLKANPQIDDRLKALSKQDPHYLAHEYFNRDWHPMHFATLAEWLSPAKVQYACTAGYIEGVDALNLTSEQVEFLSEIKDPTFKESVRDFMTNSRFRRDYWVKGARRVALPEQVEMLRAEKIVLITPLNDVKLKVTGAAGEADLKADVYRPVLDVLADHQPKSIGEIQQLVHGSNIKFNQLMQVIMVLAGAGHLAPAQPEAAVAAVKDRCIRLNSHLISQSAKVGDINWMACPVTGGAIGVGRVAQLFLFSIVHGKVKQAEWVEEAWQVLSSQGHKLIKEGQSIEGEEASLAELTRQAAEFATKQLPALQALQVV